MVPASTLMYGSIFWSVTRKPRASSSEPMEADAKPVPSDDTTPPVTKMYFVATSSLLPGRQPVSHILDFSVSIPGRAVESPVAEIIEHLRHRRPATDPELHHVVSPQGGTNTARGVHPPFDRRARGGVPAEPQRGQLHIAAIAQQARARRARRARAQSRPDVAARLERARRARERLPRSAEPTQGGGCDLRRLLGEHGLQRELEARDVEATAPGPRPGHRQRVDARRRRAREAIARIEQAKDT